jgi:hypothetical protein
LGNRPTAVERSNLTPEAFFRQPSLNRLAGRADHAPTLPLDPLDNCHLPAVAVDSHLLPNYVGKRSAALSRLFATVWMAKYEN